MLCLCGTCVAADAAGPRLGSLLQPLPLGLPVSSVQARQPLGVDSGMSPAYAERRRLALRAFEAWLAAEHYPAVHALASSGVLLGMLLAQFGRYLHDHGYASYWLTHAVLAVTGHYPFWKPFMAPAWTVL